MSNRFYDRVELVFFKYGLFASRHPILMICFSAIMVLMCCYPLLNLPLPGSEPTQFFTLTKDFQDYGHRIGEEFPKLTGGKHKPHWFSYSNQTAYIQQFLIKSAIKPSRDQKVSKSEAFRASLSTVFSILDKIEGFALKSENLSIASDCFHVNDTVISQKQPIKSLFPKDGCLLVSPAVYWSNHFDLFEKDPNVQQTISQYEGKSIKPTLSVKELLFGVQLKRSRIRNVKLEQYTDLFAITLVLKRYDPKLIEALQKHLHDNYSVPKLEQYHQHCAIEIHNGANTVCANLSQIITHIHYKPQMRFNDLIPLLSTYFILGCYIYFSVRKINFVKSKLGMAFAAVVSVMASLMMAVGLCSLIGLTPALNGGEIFPYLVCFIGLENILVLTKSVVATPTHMEVEKRIAYGLSYEGCPIVKNFLLELILISLGYFSVYPEIQEFCAFALVGVVSDFLMHMLFFVTVLSIDIRRLDVAEDVYSQTDESDSHDLDTHSSKNLVHFRNRRNRLHRLSEPHTAETGGKKETYLKIPKRLKLVFFFADTRMIQRGLMVSLVIWIALIMYRVPVQMLQSTKAPPVELRYQTKLNLDSLTLVEDAQEHKTWPLFGNEDVMWSHKDLLSFQRLSFRHWPVLFAYYNITVAERFISMLPPILIPVKLDSNDMKPFLNTDTRHESDNVFTPSTVSQVMKESINFHLPSHFYTGRYQMTGLDYYLTLLLGAVSGMFMVFLLNIMYQCICSRNYGNLSSSTIQLGNMTVDSFECYTSSIGETIPLVLSGHRHLVECVHIEGVTVTSSDISGELRTWDSHSGECTSVIDRSRVSRSNSYNANLEDHQLEHKYSSESCPSVWCLTCCGQYIIVGCDTGQIEVWDSASATLTFKYGKGKSGVIVLVCEGYNVVAARIDGVLEFFMLETSIVNSISTIQSNIQYRGSHWVGDKPNETRLDMPVSATLRLMLPAKRAHQHPISAVEIRRGRILTGSCDHTLKLFTIQDGRCQYSMFGHTGPITALCMDKDAPLGAVSGATDGTVRLWDLLTGLCVHKLEEHSGSITAVRCSENHVVSTAHDDKLCIWARRSGVLLQMARLSGASSSAMSLLGQKLNWCVTGGRGGLLLWDIRNGELLRRVPLVYDSAVLPSVEHIDVATDLCVVCVLGHELFVVRFPSILEKN